MGRNLSTLFISQSYQFLTQISGSELQDGLGNTITGSLAITSSQAVSASFATTASFALNAGAAINTGSLLTTASISNATTTYTKGDGSTFSLTTNNVVNATSASLATSASQAVSASYSNVATSSSYALVSTSSSFATNANNASTASIATSASYALTASFALNAGTTVSTASLLTTASAVANVITFTKGDGSTFPVTIATGSAVSASFASTASLALNNVLTASNTNATITYTKGDGTTFTNVINNVVNATSASFATSASQAVSASQAQTAVSSSFATSASVATSASFATSASQAVSSSFAISSSVATSASFATSASQATTASFAQNIASGLSPTFANVTASNVMITGTASVALLYTQTISSSVIFSSGSNLLGDSSTLDTQTLIGIVKTSGSFSATGSSNFTGGDFKVTDQNRNGEFDVDFFKVKTVNGTQFTGSVSSLNGFTGSLAGTASFATTASFAISASYAPSGNPFPFTGSAAISGTIDFNGKSTQTQNIIKFGGDKGFYADATGSIVIGFDSYHTSSGRHNIVIGSASLQNATTAADNVLIGYRTGQLLTTGRQNVIIGTEADGNWTGKNITTGTNNVWIGQGVGNNSNGDSTNNVLIGYHVGLQGTQGASNVGLGTGVFREGVGAYNVALGDGPMYGATGADRNIAFGNYTAFDITGDQNIFIGDRVQGIGTGQWTGSRYFALGSETHATGSLLYGYHGTAIPKFLTVNGDLNVSGSITGPGVIFTNPTGSNNAVGYADATYSNTSPGTPGATLFVSSSLIFSNNVSASSVRNVAIVGGKNHKAYDIIGDAWAVDSSGIFGGSDHEMKFSGSNNAIIGGQSNDLEAVGLKNSVIVGGQSHRLYATENSVILGGTSIDARTASHRSAFLGGSGGTFDYLQDSAVIASNNTTFVGGTLNNVTVLSSKDISKNAVGTDITSSVVIAAVDGSQPNRNLNKPYTLYSERLQTFNGAEITGSVIITGSLTVTGSVLGNVIGNNTDTYTSSAAVQQVVTLTQAEYNAIGSPNANTFYVISGSAPNATLASNTFVGNQVFSGSVRGVVISGSTTSNTSSLDFSAGNFFTLNTNNILNTHIVPNNIQSGQTVNLELTYPATASAISFPSYVKQPSGSAYSPSGANTTDILTFIVFNSGSVYLSSVKNMI